ncbi:MAG: hypothetical protein ACFNXE_04265, partial [Rothia dentocariosa]
MGGTPCQRSGGLIMFSLTVFLLGGLGAMTRYFLDVKMSPRLRTEHRPACGRARAAHAPPRRRAQRLPDRHARFS